MRLLPLALVPTPFAVSGRLASCETLVYVDIRAWLVEFFYGLFRYLELTKSSAWKLELIFKFIFV